MTIATRRLCRIPPADMTACRWLASQKEEVLSQLSESKLPSSWGSGRGFATFSFQLVLRGGGGGTALKDRKESGPISPLIRSTIDGSAKAGRSGAGLGATILGSR
jgi:hypothetical protein